MCEGGNGDAQQPQPVVEDDVVVIEHPRRRRRARRSPRRHATTNHQPHGTTTTSTTPVSSLESVPPIVQGVATADLVYRTPQLLGSLVVTHHKNQSHGVVNAEDTPDERKDLAGEPLPSATAAPSPPPPQANDRNDSNDDTDWFDTLTVTLPVPPLLFCERYLVAASQCGKVYLWDLADLMGWKEQQQEPFSSTRLVAVDTTTPLAPVSISVETNTVGPLTAMAVGALSTPSNSNDADGLPCVVVCCAAGMVSVLVVLEGLQDNSSSQQLPSFQAVSTWNTGSVGISTVAMRQPGELFLGYSSGHVEAWRVCHRRNNDDDPTSKEDTSSWESKLLWRGAFPDRPRVCAVSLLGHDGMKNMSNSVRSAYYLAVTLSYHHLQSEYKSSVQVINLASATEAFLAPAAESASASIGNFRIADLNEHCILPAPGMEPTDPSSGSNSSPVITSLGTNCLSAANTTSSVAAGLSDGTVLLLRTDVDGDGECSTSVTPSWGVQRQFQLSYPCVGIGTVELSTTSEDGEPVVDEYTACCLRGTSTYLFHRDKTKDAQAIVLPPEIVEDDVSIPQCLQNFSAFTATMPNGQTAPMLVYVWPGGTIDVFSCGLLYGHVDLLQELIGNGSVEKLRSILLVVGNDTPLDSRNDGLGPGWERAREEVRACSTPHALRLSDLCAAEFAKFRELLLQLAGEERS